MRLREYLYLDTRSVRGVTAQLGQGIDKESSKGGATSTENKFGAPKMAEHSRGWEEYSSIVRDLSENVFPDLELHLEAKGLMLDASEIVEDSSKWENMKSHLPEGRIIRITCQGFLTDSRYYAGMMSRAAFAAHGVHTFQNLNEKKSKNGQGNRLKFNWRNDAPKNIEDEIPLGPIPALGVDASGEMLRGLVQVMRGMFSPGLHLALLPSVREGGAITMRLPEGNDYLVDDPDIIFSRYGVGLQEWTVVGTVGHYAGDGSPLDSAKYLKSNGKFVRAQFAKSMGGWLELFGNSGFADLAQSPGFTVVPWVIYRDIGMVGSSIIG